MITPIESLGSISPVQQQQEESPALVQPGDGMFTTIFKSAIQNVKDTNQDMVQNQYLLSTGQLDNPSTLMISMVKYQTATDLLIQLRSRALDAYSELTRMSL